MIFGIGIDIVELKRIESILKRNSHSFIERILTSREQEYLPESGRRRVEYIAGRFAAKEAAAKALGTGIGKSFSFLDGEVLKDEMGKPMLIFSDSTKQHFNFHGSYKVHVSISHSREYAIAQVIIEML
jgi:holo-[acyl-carrier protein] synthase